MDIVEIKINDYWTRSLRVRIISIDLFAVSVTHITPISSIPLVSSHFFRLSDKHRIKNKQSVYLLSLKLNNLN